MSDSRATSNSAAQAQAEVDELVGILDHLERLREPLDVAGVAEKLHVLTLLVVRLAHFQLGTMRNV